MLAQVRGSQPPTRTSDWVPGPGWLSPDRSEHRGGNQQVRDLCRHTRRRSRCQLRLLPTAQALLQARAGVTTRPRLLPDHRDRPPPRVFYRLSQAKKPRACALPADRAAPAAHSQPWDGPAPTQRRFPKRDDRRGPPRPRGDGAASPRPPGRDPRTSPRTDTAAASSPRSATSPGPTAAGGTKVPPNPRRSRAEEPSRTPAAPLGPEPSLRGRTVHRRSQTARGFQRPAGSERQPAGAGKATPSADADPAAAPRAPEGKRRATRRGDNGLPRGARPGLGSSAGRAPEPRPGPAPT